MQQTPQTLQPADILQLQRAIGNRATGQLLQAKLRLGPAGDRYEQEADQVAKQVVRASRQPAVKQENVQREGADEDELQMKPLADRISQVRRSYFAPPNVQREGMEEEELQAKRNTSVQREGMEEEDELQAAPNHGLEGGDVDTDVARSIQSARGGGHPLHDRLRSSMERGFGADFSGVRVHTGGQADALNRSLNARAFTTGKDIFFGKGQYNPGSSGGQELIAHELTHTVQQGAAGVQRVRSEPEAIQRLTVQDTQWQQADDIQASGGGAGGVLFINDGNGAVVVKPGIHAAEEQLASYLHQVIAQTTGNTNDGWNIQALDVRIASPDDIVAIRQAVQRVFGQNQLPDRVNNLINRLAAGSTMIQSPAQLSPGEEGTVGERLAQVGQSNEGHMQSRKGGRSKVRGNSPIKALLNDPGLSITMGRAAASDIFLGNYDRFVGNANYENWMMDTQQKRIVLIDNVVDEAKARFQPWAQGGAFDQPNQQNGWQRQEMPQFNFWSQWGPVRRIAAGEYAELAQAVWSGSLSNEAMDSGLANTMLDELLEGGTAGDNGQNFVKQEERAKIRKKLLREKHMQTLTTNFVIGLQQGIQAIIDNNNGQLPGNLPVSRGVKVMYRARILRLLGTQTDQCMNQAQNELGGRL